MQEKENIFLKTGGAIFCTKSFGGGPLQQYRIYIANILEDIRKRRKWGQTHIEFFIKGKDQLKATQL